MESAVIVAESVKIGPHSALMTGYLKEESGLAEKLFIFCPKKKLPADLLN